MKHYKTKKGFSIGEVLLSMTILVIGIIGVMELSTQNVSILGESRNILVGTQLAQGGIELTRNYRDNNVAQGFDEFADMEDGEECVIDHEGPIECLNQPGRYGLRLNAAGFFVRDTSGSHQYNRKITFDITDPQGTGEIQNLVTSYSWWGALEPSAPSECTTINDCVFAQITLTRWLLGEL